MKSTTPKHAVKFAISLAFVVGACELPTVGAVDLLSENFDELVLRNAVTFQSEVRGRKVWTPDPPSGAGVEGTWSVDNSALPPESTSDLIGVAEFEGWTFVDKDWWITTADVGQLREQFVSASGVIAVADPDEWDDFGSPQSPTSYGRFDSTLRISNIPLQGVAPNTARLFFHSSWRFEGIQKASLTAKYNDPANTVVPLFVWDSDQGSPNFKDDATNEAVNVPVMNPAGATMATLEFRLYDAGNNWWWAIDNVNLFTGVAPAQDGVLRLIIDRGNGQVRVVNNTAGTVNLRGYSIESAAGALSESAATYLGDSNSNWRILDNPTSSELSEGYLPDQYAMPTQAANPALGVINLGNAWQKYYQDISDVTFKYLVAGQDAPVSGIVEFIGNSDQSYHSLDLNFDGQISLLDYSAFLAGYNTSLAGKTAAQRHNLGDLDADGKHAVGDFLEFKRLFDQLRGPNALEALLAAGESVPEPSSLAIVLAACGVGWTRRRRPRIAAYAAALLASFVLLESRAAASLPLLVENFDGIPLGQSPEEQPTQFAVWSDAGPPGWTIDRSGVPGYSLGDPTMDGVKDWAGWNFAKREWWSTVAGAQDREKFTRGVGAVMVADPDEWDDAAHATGLYNTFATTPVINIPANVPAGKIRLAFDSSWRPEGNDDLPNLANNQTATINVRYNGGAYQNVLTWDSLPGPTFKADAPNEAVDISLNYNGSATTLQLQFGLGLAENDWWWAIDNIRVFVPSNPAILQINTVTGNAQLVGGDVISETINGYDILSANGNLAPSGNRGLSFTKPNPVDGPDGDAVVGSTLGENWQLAASHANQFSEFFLDGSSSFTDARTEPLGHIFNPATPVANRDVQFIYTTVFGDVVAGVVQYIATAVGPDLDGNGFVDGNDILLGQRGLGTTVTAGEFANIVAHFGQAAEVAAAAAVPEPGGVALAAVGLAMLTLVRCDWRRRLRREPAIVVAAVAAVASAASLGNAQAIPAPFVDRNYRLGDGDPGAANGVAVSVTRDDAGATMMNQLIDMTAQTRAGGAPQYVTISGRPDGGGGLGIRLNPNPSDRQYLRTGVDEALNYPARSPSSTEGTLPGGTIDYQFITDRGFQLWVQPIAATEGYIVMDSNNHGVLVNAAGKFAMRYAALDYTGVTSVAPGAWYHLEVVRAFGDAGSGSVLYVNGVAEAAATGSYFGEDRPNDEMDPANQDNSPLVIGSTTSESPFQVGTQRYFRGVVDDLTMFVMGFNNSSDYGEFEFARDNAYAARFAPTAPGELDGVAGITIADVNIFANNWRFENTLHWMQGGTARSLVVGDLNSRAKGDFNYDGRVDLADWGILNAVNPALGAAALALINAVPEPTSISLGLVAGASAFGRRRRRPATRMRGRKSS